MLLGNEDAGLKLSTTAASTAATAFQHALRAFAASYRVRLSDGSSLSTMRTHVAVAVGLLGRSLADQDVDADTTPSDRSLAHGSPNTDLLSHGHAVL